MLKWKVSKLKLQNGNKELIFGSITEKGLY
jgi:hypothetical protein